MKKLIVTALITASTFIGQVHAADVFAENNISEREVRETLYQAQETAAQVLEKSGFQEYGTVALCLSGKATFYTNGIAKFICTNLIDSYEVTLRTGFQLGGSLTIHLHAIYFSTGKKIDNGEYCYKGATVGFTYIAGAGVSSMTERPCDKSKNEKLDGTGVFIDLGVGVGAAGELGYDYVKVRRL